MSKEYAEKEKKTAQRANFLESELAKFKSNFSSQLKDKLEIEINSKIDIIGNPDHLKAIEETTLRMNEASTTTRKRCWSSTSCTRLSSRRRIRRDTTATMPTSSSSSSFATR